MTGRSAASAFASAMASLVDRHETADVLARLVEDAAEIYPAAAVAIMVADRAGRLEPLSASSHESNELEALQSQQDTGPCVDAVRQDTNVVSVGVQDMVARWGKVGTAIGSAGFESVHAYPMHWRGRPLGGLNIFLGSESAPDEQARMLGQLLADVATLVVVRADVAEGQVTARIHEALTARAAVEQAKGVIAHQHDLDMAAAYAHLLRESRRTELPLTVLARRIVSRAHT